MFNRATQIRWRAECNPSSTACLLSLVVFLIVCFSHRHSGRACIFRTCLLLPSAAPLFLLQKCLEFFIILPEPYTIFLAPVEFLARLGDCSDDIEIGECVVLDGDLDHFRCREVNLEVDGVRVRS